NETPQQGSMNAVPVTLPTYGAPAAGSPAARKPPAKLARTAHHAAPKKSAKAERLRERIEKLEEEIVELRGNAQAKGGYDPVPVGQAEPLSRRLRLVDEMIRKYGRAYDYRIHTVKELEAILADLDAQARPAQPATGAQPGDLAPPSEDSDGDSAT